MVKKIKKNIRGRLSDGTPNPIDRHVGVRIRLRRCMLGFSQEKLAEELGITFQQVQKYEKGANRVGASRLWDLSQVLSVPVDFFYCDLDEKTCKSSPRKITGAFGMAEANDFDSSSIDIFGRKDISELISSYESIKDVKVRKQVLTLVKTLSKAHAAEVAEDDE
ncbi:MAG: helix-turn-helix domain-containing protein [Lactobacillales bacterium]|jgi:transcriptional regulator with XRE-family HTH domain|nr:helix-turn-helix domain-containing protein [Lactobacillales bacterium]